MNVRYLAARIIDQVLKGHSLPEALTAENAALNPRDRAFLQALTYGVCRFYFQLDTIAKHLMTKPLKKKDQVIEALILVGLYQLMAMRVPPHAVLKETVAASASFKKIWAKSLVNAVLRQFLRQKETILTQIEQDPIGYYAHPAWMIEMVQAAYPTDWKNILQGNNALPPLSLRVNQRKVSRENYLKKVEGDIIQETKQGIVLKTPLDVNDLPGFLAGEVSVQDGAAQCASELLQLEPHQTVLDACAAPGGKATHILEIEPSVHLTAIDINPTRLQAIEENLKRLGLHATLFAADVLATHAWWNGELFDRILLDVPCSASGIIRRHPDIKLLRRQTDIATLAMEQARLLKGMWSLLKPGGLLLYVTCSIFPAENAQVVSAFLQTEKTASEDTILESLGVRCEVGRQILPGSINLDGFYFARLKKRM